MSIFCGINSFVLLSLLIDNRLSSVTRNATYGKVLSNGLVKENIDENQETAEQIHDDTNNLDFASLVKCPSFVDKTLLVKAFFDNGHSILTTAPSSFGRSSVLVTLKSFLELSEGQEEKTLVNYASQSVADTNNYRLFAENKLKIIDLYPEIANRHLGRYPVVYVSFQKSLPTPTDGIFGHYSRAIRRCFRKHGYLSRSERLNETDRKRFDSWYNESSPGEKIVPIEDALKLLSSLLFKHYDRKKVVILIDDFDDPIVELTLTSSIEPLNRIIDLSNRIVSTVLEDSEHVERTFITATSYIACSGLSANLARYRFLNVHPFTEFYGLTGSEVNDLLTKYNRRGEEKFVRSKFDGYRPIVSDTTIYNTGCLSDLIKFSNESVFWPLTEPFVLTVRRLLNVNKFRDDLTTLLAGRNVNIVYDDRPSVEDIYKLNHLVRYPISNRTDVDIGWVFLLEHGYLTPIRKLNGSNQIEVGIPNESVKEKFIRFLAEYYNVEPAIIGSDNN